MENKEEKNIVKEEKHIENKEVNESHQHNSHEKEHNCDKRKLLEEKIKLLESKNKELENNIKEIKDSNLRLQAEMQNIRRHKDEEIFNMAKYEGEDIIKRIIPIVDNFERALSLENEDNKKFLEGFRMIYNKLLDILNEYEVSVIDEKDIDFDPNIHQAVLTESKDSIEPNKVLDVLQKGYKYKDKLLRPAMVKVSK